MKVDFKHSKYSILWRDWGKPTGVVDACQGIIAPSASLSAPRILDLKVSTDNKEYRPRGN
jgi:hypothetical protein